MIQDILFFDGNNRIQATAFSRVLIINGSFMYHQTINNKPCTLMNSAISPDRHLFTKTQNE